MNLSSKGFCIIVRCVLIISLAYHKCINYQLHSHDNYGHSHSHNYIVIVMIILQSIHSLILKMETFNTKKKFAWN